MSSSADPKPIIVGDDGTKPIILAYDETKFRTGDTVNLVTGGGLTHEGPYLINDVFSSTKRYTLTLETGESVNGGAEVDEKDLVAA
ncbi:hypothetical protein QBC43DRAFT_324186 [Cladorrhinum sp. PSN259]|nr:hypothetical protein QBC43DRAFT_324186 [Cladorrhinum sp. PSN259]